MEVGGWTDSLSHLARKSTEGGRSQEASILVLTIDSSPLLGPQFSRLWNEVEGV